MGKRGSKVTAQQKAKVLKLLETHALKTVAHQTNLSVSEIYKIRKEAQSQDFKELTDKLTVPYGIVENLEIKLPHNQVWIEKLRIVAGRPCDFNVTIRAKSWSASESRGGPFLNPTDDVIELATRGQIMEYTKPIPYGDRDGSKKLHIRIYWGTVLNLKYMPSELEFTVAVWVRPMGKNSLETLIQSGDEDLSGGTRVITPTYYGPIEEFAPPTDL